MVCQKNLGVDSNLRPRARLASPACRHVSASSRGRIDVHTDLVVSEVAVERGVVLFIGAMTRIAQSSNKIYSVSDEPFECLETEVETVWQVD